MTGGYRREIDGLRALAVLAVMLFHARVPGFSGGFAGVDIFLVISGYLIAGLILREAEAGSFSLIGFYERRIRRILPALVAMLVFTAIAGWILLPEDFRNFGVSLSAISAMLSNFLFERNSGYFRMTAEATPLLHTWSLAVEEQFYLFFPILLLAVRRRGAITTRVALAVIALLSFAYSVWAAHADPAMAFYSPLSRAWEFLAGALLATGMIPAPARRDLGDAAAVLGFGLLVFALFSLSPAASFPGINALAPVLGTALLLYGTQSEGSRIARLLGARPLVAMGLISYSLYLWHWPLIVFGGYYVLSPSRLEWVRIAMVLLAFPIAWASWRYVEQPFRKPRLILSRRALFASAAAASLALGLYGAAIYALNGVPGRFDPIVQRLTERGNRPDYGCTGRPIDQLLADPACRLGGMETGPRFILWGDSHAAVYIPELRRQAQLNGVSGYALTSLGCPPLFAPRVTRNLSGARLTECPKRNGRIYALIVEQRPRAVILAGQWGIYTGAKGGKRRIEGADDFGPFERGLINLRALGVTVYFVFDVPRTGTYSGESLAKAMVLGRRELMEPRTADHLRQSVAWRNHALDWERRGLVRVINPATLLCGPVTCRMTDKGYPLYFDSNHLNARGAAFVGPAFVPMMRSLAQ